MKPTDQARWMGVVESYLAGGWFTEGKLTDSAQDVVFADTGQLEAGYYDACFVIWNGPATTEGYYITHRNAANDADVKSQVIFMAATSMFNMEWLRNYKVAENERLRITCMSAMVGSAQASIFGNRRA